MQQPEFPGQSYGVPQDARPATSGTGAPQASRLRRWWWTSVPVWSLGMLAWAPFFRRAIATRQRGDWLVTAGYLAASVLGAVLVSGPGSDAGGFFTIALMAAAAAHTAVLYRRPATAGGVAPDQNAAAVVEATRAERHRAEARRIVQSDPVLARDLHIGRPDLPRTYDDGGVVDANHVPADILARMLGWTVAEAETIVEARRHTGGFGSLAELTSYAAIDPHRVDTVADLLVFCRM